MRDIIVFGTGVMGKRTTFFLEKAYNILFFTDNDERKWKTTFGNYRIEAPSELKNYNCDVVISSRIYALEIAEQLRQMGISQDRIYFCYTFQSDGIVEFEIYPFIEAHLIGAETSLIQYDLFHMEEEETRNRKVLIFCRNYSVYTKQLIENMTKRYNDIEFSLLMANATESKEKIVSSQLKHIYCFQTMADLKSILEQLPLYDVMHLLWMEKEWAYFYRLIRARARQLNLNVGGSDFYRSGKIVRDYKRELIKCVDCVFAQTEATIQEFVEYYGEQVKSKTYLLPYGIEVLDWINHNKASKDTIKERFQIPLNKIVVTCGHNANNAHQHMEIIDAIERMEDNIKQKLVCVFPMTYPQGKDDYIKSIKERLEQNGLDYVIMTEFLDLKGMAEYALISDVMIHVQITDQLSSSMLEEMYAGSIVIAGKWLPYQSLHKMGIFFLDVDRVADITETLEDIITNMQKYKKKCVGNKEIVWKHSSWDEQAPKWNAFWTV